MKKFKKYFYFLSTILSFYLVVACGASKGVSVLMTGEDIYKDETFQEIVKNEKRLHAMLSGKYVQYNKVSGEYKTWMVNGGQDSVIIYFIPAGNPSKEGLWLYHYQLMTSLPNEPIYEAFSKLVVIDRDSIRQEYYEAPDDFNYTIDELLKNPDAAFEEVNFSKLKPSIAGEEVIYFREKALYFVGESQFIPNKTDASKTYGHFIKDHYDVRPSGLMYNAHYYDKEKNKFSAVEPDKLVKMARIKGFGQKESNNKKKK